jgi:putative PIN family toxin of toxin-antitoxin system
MPRVVFDTVVFVRALINPYGLWGRLIFAHADAYHLIVSPPVIQEILEVIHRPELMRRFRSLGGLDLARTIQILEQAEIVDITDIPPVSRDSKDDKFLATAHVGAAEYLVSEDQDLLVLRTYGPVTITGARTFIDMLERPRPVA